jgi:hypothetical protein
MSHRRALIIVDNVPPEPIRAAPHDVARCAVHVHDLAVRTCSTTIWAVSPPTNTSRTFAFSGRPSLISCSSMAVNSARSVMVRPSFATNTASGAYKAIIASIFPELNRLSRDGITPSGSVGSGKLSDIRGLLFVLVEMVALGVTR